MSNFQFLPLHKTVKAKWSSSLCSSILKQHLCLGRYLWESQQVGIKPAWAANNLDTSITSIFWRPVGLKAGRLKPECSYCHFSKCSVFLKSYPEKSWDRLYIHFRANQDLQGEWSPLGIWMGRANSPNKIKIQKNNSSILAMSGKSGAWNSNVPSSRSVSLKNLRPKATFNFFGWNIFSLCKNCCKPLWSQGLGIELAFCTYFPSCFHLPGSFLPIVFGFGCFLFPGFETMTYHNCALSLWTYWNFTVSLPLLHFQFQMYHMSAIVALIPPLIQIYIDLSMYV